MKSYLFLDKMNKTPQKGFCCTCADVNPTTLHTYLNFLFGKLWSDSEFRSSKITSIIISYLHIVICPICTETLCFKFNKILCFIFTTFKLMKILILELAVQIDSRVQQISVVILKLKN